MVRKSVCLIGAAALCVLLAACSMFPASLAQVIAQRDLSGVIASGTGGEYDVFAVTAHDGTQFVIVIDQSGSLDPAIVVMNGDLAILQVYTRSQLTTSPYPTTFGGGEVAVGADGNVGIGNYIFTTSQLANGGGATQMPSGGAGSSTISSYHTGIVLENFRYDGSLDTLSFDQYTLAWVYSTSWSFAFGDASSASTDVGAWLTKDDLSTGQVIIARTSYQNDSRTVILKIPLSTLMSMGLTTPLVGTYKIGELSHLDTRSIGLLGGELVAFNYDTHALTRYSLTDLSNLGEVAEVRSDDTVRWAYSNDGGYAVTFDQANRVVSKVAQWW